MHEVGQRAQRLVDVGRRDRAGGSGRGRCSRCRGGAGSPRTPARSSGASCRCCSDPRPCCRAPWWRARCRRGGPGSPWPTISSDSPRRVDVGGVDEVDPGVERGVDHAIDSSWSRLPHAPNIIAPRHRPGLTSTPLRPSLRFPCWLLSFGCGRYPGPPPVAVPRPGASPCPSLSRHRWEPSTHRLCRSAASATASATGARSPTSRSTCRPGASWLSWVPNGAGKTHAVLDRHAALRPAPGAVAVFGHDLARSPRGARRDRRGVPGAHPRPDLTVAPEPRSTTPPCMASRERAARRRIAALLDRGGLAERSDDKVRTLSGGQSRRSRSPARSSTRRACCCSTSRPSASTSHRAPTSSRSCGRWCGRRSIVGALGHPYLRGDRAGRTGRGAAQGPRRRGRIRPSTIVRRARQPRRRLPPADRRSGAVAA